MRSNLSPLGRVPLCGGDGGPSDKPCIECHGSGVSQHMRCPTYDGTGEVERRACSGEGVCTCDCGDEHGCRDCDGDGRVDCDLCSGTGYASGAPEKRMPYAKSSDAPISGSALRVH